MPAPINRWVICFSGWLQDEGKPTGIVKLWRSLRYLAAPDTCVELRSWCQSASDLAELIWRTAPERGEDKVRPIVQLIGYSWGGYSAVLLARELHRRGLFVDHLILGDAVHRHPYWFGRWRALVPWRIKIPNNVVRLKSCYQRRSWPRGHRLVCESTLTMVDPPLLLDVDHTYLDDHPDFHEMALEAIR